MKRFASVLTALAAFGLATATQADPLTLNSPGVVGIYNLLEQTNAAPATEITHAQHLLDMLKSTTDGLYQTSDTEYSGTLVLDDATSGWLDLSGYDWAFAKYDGRNAGYVLFHLGGAQASTIVSEFPADLWTTNPEKYRLSHITLFNKTTNVPDGGTTLGLLGFALVLLVVFAQRKVFC